MLLNLILECLPSIFLFLGVTLSQLHSVVAIAAVHQISNLQNPRDCRRREISRKASIQASSQIYNANYPLGLPLASSSTCFWPSVANSVTAINGLTEDTNTRFPRWDSSGKLRWPMTCHNKADWVHSIKNANKKYLWEWKTITFLKSSQSWAQPIHGSTPFPFLHIDLCRPCQTPENMKERNANRNSSTHLLVFKDETHFQ